MEQSWLIDRKNQMCLFDYFNWTGVQDVPEEILHSLAQWALLYDVPFPYMAVREEMLPPESIRFFFLDKNYIAALLDGAMSPGRSFTIDYQHDAKVIETVMDKALCESTRIRPRLQKKEANSPEDGKNALSGAVTGFLLRSVMVSGWRGLECKAFEEENEKVPLRALRLETLGAEVLLGLYVGEIKKLVIAQPPEGMHFGFSCKQGRDTAKQGNTFEKRVRSLTDGRLLEGEAALADVVLRDNKYRVVNLSETMVNIRNALGEGTINSAFTALEMIQNPYTGEVARDR